MVTGYKTFYCQLLCLLCYGFILETLFTHLTFSFLFLERYALWINGITFQTLRTLGERKNWRTSDEHSVHRTWKNTMWHRIVIFYALHSLCRLHHYWTGHSATYNSCVNISLVGRTEICVTIEVWWMVRLLKAIYSHALLMIQDWISKLQRYTWLCSFHWCVKEKFGATMKG